MAMLWEELLMVDTVARGVASKSAWEQLVKMLSPLKFRTEPLGLNAR